MKKKGNERIDSFDKLATLIVGEIQDFREEVNERFEKVERELVNIRVDMQSGFDETKKILERHDTRISALEYKTFGIQDSDTTIKK